MHHGSPPAPIADSLPAGAVRADCAAPGNRWKAPIITKGKCMLAIDDQLNQAHRLAQEHPQRADSQGTCAELTAVGGDTIGIRDTKQNGTGSVLAVEAAMEAVLQKAKAGRLDR